MPSITTIDGFTFNNWGPVTTTFTAPASCATATNNMRIGANTTAPFWIYANQCSTFPYYDCIPTGTAKVTTTYDTDPMGILEYPYFSPGLDCPAGWNTVGVAARDADSSLSASGLLEPTTTVQSPSLIPHWENAATLFVDLLDPGETAVVCCPSSMTADIDFGCYSTVSEYKVSTGCYRVFPDADLDEVTKTYTVNGTTARGLVETVTGTYPITEVKTVTFDASKASSLVGISVMPVITLVHRQSDLQNAATATTTTGPAESASNAAGRVGLRLGSWDGLGAVLGLTVVAMGLGATIILA